MVILFYAILILDIPIAIASFVFAYILLRRAKNNHIYFNFGMAVLFLALWLAGIVVNSFGFLPGFSTFIENLSFALGIGILHYFLIFTLSFPLPSPRRSLKVGILYFFTSLIALSCFIPGLYVISSVSTHPFIYADVNPFGLALYSIYFTLLSVLSFVNLIYKYKNNDGIFRLQLKKIILGTIIAIVVNLFFRITVLFLGHHDTSPIGAFFTFTVLIYIYSILFSKKLY